MKKTLKNSLMFMLVIFALFLGVNSADFTASAASEDELFTKYVSSNYKMFDKNKVTDENASGVICYLIKDFDNDKSKEMFMFSRDNKITYIYLFEISGGKVVFRNKEKMDISITGAGASSLTNCVYLDGTTVRLENQLINYGGASCKKTYTSFTVKNGKVVKLNDLYSLFYPRVYGDTVYKNEVSDVTYTSAEAFEKAVKSAGFTMNSHNHMPKEFNPRKDDPQKTQCFKGKHIFTIVSTNEYYVGGKYGFIVDNTANLKDTSSKTTTPGKVTGLKATSTTSALKLSWKKVSGATGYRVYKKTSDGWKKLADVTSTSYTIKNLKAGNKLTLRVRAFTKKNGKTTYGSYSANFVTATKPATPTLKVTSTAAGKATLTWKNVSGESGYQIYYSTKKDSGYKKLTTLKANTAKYTASKLTSGKTYYFRVRAYIKLSSGNVYGGYKTVSVKVKAASSNKLTNAKAKELWTTANKVHNQWFFRRQSQGYVDTSKSIKLNGTTYYLVKHSSIDSVADLKAYLAKYFDASIYNSILSDYINYNGKLYACMFARGGLARDIKNVTVKSQSGNNAQLNLTFYDRFEKGNVTLVQKMKYTGGRWIFTENFFMA